MKNRPNIILCLFLLLAPATRAQDDNFLDLTKMGFPKKEKVRGWGGSVGTGKSGDSRSSVDFVPLKLTLLNCDKLNYQLGDRVIYDVMLENVGDKTYVIPWSPDWEKVEGNAEEPPPGYLAAYLTLAIHDDTWGEMSMNGVALYGSKLLRGSLKSLRPGETVRIRAFSRWEFTEGEVARKVLTKLPSAFRVEARFSFMYSNTSIPLVISTNSLTVELKRRRQW
jgi:hypothetical protein